MTTAVLLVLLGALSRLIPHPPNFVALGALALYSGARLPRRWAFVVPLGAMALSDLVLDFGTGRARSSRRRASRSTRPSPLIVVAGRLARGARRRRCGSPGSAVGAVGSLLPHLEFRRVARRSAVSEDAGRPRALLRGGHPVLLEHALRGSARHGGSLRPRRALASRAPADRSPGRGGVALRPSCAAGAGARAADSARLRGRRRHGDVRSRGREGRRLGDHRHHAARSSSSTSRSTVSDVLRDGARARRRAAGNARLADVALHARNELDADARPRRRRADELAVLRRLRLVRR